MTKTTFTAQLAKLPIRTQVALLTACVEHVYPNCTRHEAVDAAVKMAWDFASDGTSNSKAIDEVTDTMDSAIGEDSPSDLLFIASAAELIVTYLHGPEEIADKVIYNIEAAVDAFAKNPDAALDAERTWQLNAAKKVAKISKDALGRDILDQLD